jgi:adenylosuccinate synthase
MNGTASTHSRRGPTAPSLRRSRSCRRAEAPIPNAPHEHNTTNEWQGAVRRGWFDAVLARYAIEAIGGIDALAITHLDWLDCLPQWTYGDAYEPAIALRASFERDLDRQQRLGETLASVRPVLRHCATHDVVETIEAVTGTPVAFGSHGPSAIDVRTRSPLRGSTPLSDDFRRHTPGPSRAAG